MRRKWIAYIAAGIWALVTIVSPAEPSRGQKSTDAGSPIRQRLEALTPASWTVSMTEDAAPVGLKVMTVRGMKARFQGTALVKAIGRDVAPGQVEEFTLWLMPLAFVPTAETNEQDRIGGAFSGSPVLLGSNQEYRVYCLTSGSAMATWPKWKQDIRSGLNLVEDAGASAPRKASRLECRDVRQCALLGVLDTPKGRVYKLKLSASDPRTYFAQSGDYVGEYILADQETATDGEAKVTLKKGTDVVPLSEQEQAQ